MVNTEGFRVGDGITIWDSQSGGFHTTVGRITGKRGNTFSFDMPLNADCLVANQAKAATAFPVISGYNLEGTGRNLDHRWQQTAERGFERVPWWWDFSVSRVWHRDTPVHGEGFQW